jgi:hypothetical protein
VAVIRDYGFNGFFQLCDPHRLFKKLRYDYDRMLADPLNEFPAWDFFLTANHLVDWIWPSAGTKQHQLDRAADAIPRICEHLADGAKHFILNRAHTAVSALDHIVDGPFDSELDPSSFDTGGLFITLERAEAVELGVERITAQDLARRVLVYWGKRFGYGDVGPTLPTAPTSRSQK